ncbi:helix-turn-helix domain-containing protein [bacterium]|nr:helix-turn-helix domain-containing protein [bacterium]
MFAEKFREFGAYAAVIEDTGRRLILPKLDLPRWEYCRFSIGDIDLQFGSEWSGNITEGACRAKGPTLFIPLHGNYHANGEPLGADSVLLIDRASEFTIRVSQQHAWCSLHLPSIALRKQPGTRTPTPRETTQIVEIDQGDIAPIKRMLIDLYNIARNEFPQGTSSVASITTERELVEICRRIMVAKSTPHLQTGRPRFVRSELMQSVRKTIERHSCEGLTIEELTTATQVSERTLRTMFREYYGMPPRRFLLVHRLNQVYSVLRTADLNETTVTAIAAQFGFAHFGRFAGAYRKLFGETPSATLSKSKRHKAALNLKTS